MRPLPTMEAQTSQHPPTNGNAPPNTHCNAPSSTCIPTHLFILAAHRHTCHMEVRTATLQLCGYVVVYYIAWDRITCPNPVCLPAVHELCSQHHLLPTSTSSQLIVLLRVVVIVAVQHGVVCQVHHATPSLSTPTQLLFSRRYGTFLGRAQYTCRTGAFI